MIDLADRNDSAGPDVRMLKRVRITGGFGNDTIEDLPQLGGEVSGGPGVDTITVHPNFGGVVEVHGGLGDDVISAVSATGVVDGDAGDDEITLFTYRPARRNFGRLRGLW